MEDYTGTLIDGASSMEEHGWRHMAKRAFWQPSGGRWNRYSASYQSKEDPNIIFYKTLGSGKEREEFIREQSHLIRRFPTDQEYADFYNFLSTMTS